MTTIIQTSRAIIGTNATDPRARRPRRAAESTAADTSIDILIADDQARASWLPHDPRSRGGSASARRGKRRRRGCRGRAYAPAGHRADGHPHANLDGIEATRRILSAGKESPRVLMLTPTLTRRLIETFIRAHPRSAKPLPELEELTARELEILELIARGLSNAEIADRLVVSGTTVKTHVARVLSKLGLRDRVQAVVLAYETGVVSRGQTEPQ